MRRQLEEEAENPIQDPKMKHYFKQPEPVDADIPLMLKEGTRWGHELAQINACVKDKNVLE